MANVDTRTLGLLKEKAFTIRCTCVRMVHQAKSGHIGGPLGLTDIFTALFFKIMKHDPANPEWEGRDRFILSNGHVVPVLYAAMAYSGYFPVEELMTLRKLNSRLQGHPSRTNLPGIEISTGSLGHGLGVAIGMALAARQKNLSHRVFCSIGDGESQEGSIWEAALSAGHHQLDNLTVFMDRNFIQIDGNTEDIVTLEPLAEKWKAFRWHVIEANGNDYDDIFHAFDMAEKYKGKPSIILFRTKLGFPVSFMDGVSKWHGTPPNDEEAEQALKEIEAYYQGGNQA
jgi:transketolase